MKECQRVFFSRSSGEYSTKFEKIEDGNGLDLIAKLIEKSSRGGIPLVIMEDMINGKHICIKCNHSGSYFRTISIMSLMFVVSKAVFTAFSIFAESSIRSFILPFFLRLPSR